jgi:hypothetical protein
MRSTSETPQATTAHREPGEAVGQDQGQRPVEPDRDCGVTAGEGVEGGRVPRVEELRTRPPEDTFENGREQEAADRRDEEQVGGEPPALEVEDKDDGGQERQNDPVVAQRRDQAHRALQPLRRAGVDPDQHGPVEPAALALDHPVGELREGPDDEGGGREPEGQPDGGCQRQTGRQPAEDLPAASE